MRGAALGGKKGLKNYKSSEFGTSTSPKLSLSLSPDRIFVYPWILSPEHKNHARISYNHRLIHIIIILTGVFINCQVTFPPKNLKSRTTDSKFSHDGAAGKWRWGGARWRATPSGVAAIVKVTNNTLSHSHQPPSQCRMTKTMTIIVVMIRLIMIIKNEQYHRHHYHNYCRRWFINFMIMIMIMITIVMMIYPPHLSASSLSSVRLFL